MTIDHLINHVSDFVHLSDRDTGLLTHVFKPSSFSKGSMLEKENTVAQRLYFIKSGFIRSFLYLDGAENTTQIKGEHEFITGFASFTSGVTSKENIQCISNCELFYIDKSDYQILTRESAAWGIFCKQVYEGVIMQDHQRTTDLLTLPAEKRYLKLLAEQPEIVQHVPMRFIASYIGIKPESLSRIRKKIIS